jgi:hypothetical protein
MWPPVAYEDMVFCAWKDRVMIKKALVDLEMIGNDWE